MEPAAPPPHPNLYRPPPLRPLAPTRDFFPSSLAIVDFGLAWRPATDAAGTSSGRNTAVIVVVE